MNGGWGGVVCWVLMSGGGGVRGEGIVRREGGGGDGASCWDGDVRAGGFAGCGLGEGVAKERC